MLKLEALQEKPWYLQVGAFGVVALLVYAAFWYFVTSGTRAETAEVEAQVEQLQRANAGAQIASQRLNEFKANYARAQADYEDLKALLPEQRELTTVLGNLQDRARGKLTLRKFTPRDDEQQDFYAAKPVEVEVTGSYNNLGQFFAQMASYQRIVSITDFKITKINDSLTQDKQAGKTVDAVFTLKAYYVSPEKLQPAPPPAQPAPNAPPQVGAATPPANPMTAAGQAAKSASNAPTAGAPAQQAK
ncbi:MAG TPA: type 4a pilus biogenesis protein PilO [Pyrinomonadaceae bacterium]|jgi:type IV pilus assembly protein PilO|nr:type 4a pilus biogenesis protein PilO [Pyrinomonadaceae bacterium]